MLEVQVSAISSEPTEWTGTPDHGPVSASKACSGVPTSSGWLTEAYSQTICPDGFPCSKDSKLPPRSDRPLTTGLASRSHTTSRPTESAEMRTIAARQLPRARAKTGILPRPKITATARTGPPPAMSQLAPRLRPRCKSMSRGLHALAGPEAALAQSRRPPVHLHRRSCTPLSR